jgi:hypothetical protein
VGQQVKVTVHPRNGDALERQSRWRTPRDKRPAGLVLSSGLRCGGPPMVIARARRAPADLPPWLVVSVVHPGRFDPLAPAPAFGDTPTYLHHTR